MTPHWYDLLDVSPAASPDEIRASWKAAVADLDPTDRRFRVYNQAAEVLLDPQRRAAYDAELAAEQQDEAESSTAADEMPASAPTQAVPASPAAPTAVQEVGRWLVPGWLLIGLAAVTAIVMGVAGWLWTRPSDASVEDSTRAAQSAAERAIVPILSYDYRHLAESQAAAHPEMTSNEQEQYDQLFSVIKKNAPSTQTVVRAKYVASGVVRSGDDRVDVLVFVDQLTTNKLRKTPIPYRNQVTVSMEKSGSSWLVDGLVTSPVGK